MALGLMALLELPEQLVLLDFQEILDHSGLTEHLDLLDFLDQVSRVPMVVPVQLDPLDRQVLLVFLVGLDFRGTEDKMESWVLLVLWEIPVFKVLDSMDHLVQRDLEDHKEHPVPME